MTLEEFDALKPGDTVIMADTHNGQKITYKWWLECVGMEATITGAFVSGLPGCPGYWPAKCNGIDWAFIWPDCINLPSRAEKAKNPCECGAHAIGVKLYAPGHSAWCGGRER